MSLVAIAIGSTAVAGVYGASRASKAQNRATDAASVAAAEQADIAREELDFYKQQYADMKPIQQQAANIANQVSMAQLESSKQNDAISRDYWDYQKNTFRPLEAGLVADAQSFDTQARRDAAAGRAIADVEQQFGSEAAQQQRAMTRMGVNPNSGRFASMSTQMGMAEAAAKAGAASKARDNIELQGYARRADAANMGRGLASSQATSAGVAMNAGNSAVNNAGAPLSQGIQMTNMMGNGYNGAQSGLTTANTMMNTANQNSANLWANSSNAVLGAAGTMAGMYFGKKG